MKLLNAITFVKQFVKLNDDFFIGCFSLYFGRKYKVVSRISILGFMVDGDCRDSINCNPNNFKVVFTLH